MQETQEMWVYSLGQEDSLEKEMVSHSRTLAWTIPWTEEPGGLQAEADGPEHGSFTQTIHTARTRPLKGHYPVGFLNTHNKKLCNHYITARTLPYPPNKADTH